MSTSAKVSPKAALLMAYLSAHIGRDKGVKAVDIASWFNWKARAVRTYITELREQGHAICGHPNTGYYVAEKPEEIEEVCAFLHARAMTSLMLIARIKKIALPELLGQLRLKT